ncbi:unnamed protein product, partial [Anisakis simplex]|uniref:PAXI n=1 Tax=Anisakis simplex TaxID=6269 RepID=A0A0M3KDR6_ANISI
RSLIQDDGTIIGPDPVLQQAPQQQTISSLRQRLRTLMGSARNIRQPSGVSCAPAQNLPTSGNYPKRILSANSSPKKRPQAY